MAQVFYAACQGLLYVLCYRLEQFMEAPVAAAAGTSPADTTDAGAGAHVIRQLFSDVMPKLLHHRSVPLAALAPVLVEVLLLPGLLKTLNDLHLRFWKRETCDLGMGGLSRVDCG